MRITQVNPCSCSGILWNVSLYVLKNTYFILQLRKLRLLEIKWHFQITQWANRRFKTVPQVLWEQLLSITHQYDHLEGRGVHSLSLNESSVETVVVKYWNWLSGNVVLSYYLGFWRLSLNTSKSLRGNLLKTHSVELEISSSYSSSTLQSCLFARVTVFI